MKNQKLLMKASEFYDTITQVKINNSFGNDHGNLIAEGKNGKLYTFSGETLIEITNKGASKLKFKTDKKITEISLFSSNCDHSCFLISAKEGIFIFSFPGAELEAENSGKKIPEKFTFIAFAQITYKDHKNSITWSPYSPKHFALIKGQEVCLADITNVDENKNIIFSESQKCSVNSCSSICFGSRADPWLQYCIFALTVEPPKSKISVITGLIPDKLKIEPKDFTKLCMSIDSECQEQFLSYCTEESGFRVFDREAAGIKPICFDAKIKDKKENIIQPNDGKIYIENDQLFVTGESGIHIFKLSNSHIWTPKSQPLKSFTFLITKPTDHTTPDFIESFSAKNETRWRITHVGKTFLLSNGNSTSTISKVYLMKDNRLHLAFDAQGRDIYGVGCSSLVPPLILFDSGETNAARLMPIPTSVIMLNTEEEPDNFTPGKMTKAIEKKKKDLLQRKKEIEIRTRKILAEIRKLSMDFSDKNEAFKKHSETMETLHNKESEIIERAGMNEVNEENYEKYKNVLDVAKMAGDFEAKLTLLEIKAKKL